MSYKTACFIYIFAVLGVFIGILYNYSYFSIHLCFFAISLFYIGYKIISGYYRFGIFSLATIFNLFGLLYTHYFILESILLNVYISENCFLAMELSTLAIMSFNFAYDVSKCKVASAINNSKCVLNVSQFTSFLAVFFIVSLCVEYYVIFIKIGFANYWGVSRAEQSLLRSGLSYLTFYSHTIPVISAISLYLYLENGGKFRLFLFLSSFLVSVLGAILTVSRADMLSVLLPLIFILNHYGRISNKSTLILGVSGILLFGIWKSLFSEKIEMQFDSEFVSWYKIVDDVLSNPNTNFLYGESYLNTILNLISPFSGSEPLSIWYVKTYLPDVYSMGGGRGFSAVLEAFLNFHVFGVVLVYFFYGYLAKKINPNTPLKIMLYMIVLVSVNMLFRSESYAFWKNMMWFKIYPILLFYFLSLRKRRYV